MRGFKTTTEDEMYNWPKDMGPMESIDYVLSGLLTPRFRRRRDKGMIKKIDLRDKFPMVPLLPGDAMNNDDEWFDLEATPSDLGFRKFKVSILTAGKKTNPIDSNAALESYTVESKGSSRVLFTELLFMPDGTFTGHEFYCDWYRSTGLWHPQNVTRCSFRVTNTSISSATNIAEIEKDPRQADHTIRCAISQAFFFQLQWRLIVSVPGGPSLSLLTNSAGARHAIENRENTKSLRLWVTNHWRQLVSDPDQDTYVRKHLRGRTDFDWAGYRCRIIVPQDAVDENVKLAKERARMRREGVDRRPHELEEQR